MSPNIEHISQIVILHPMECLIFRGRWSKGEQFTYGEALPISNACHQETTTWIGCRVRMHCILCTLRDAREDLHMLRDQEWDKMFEHVCQQHQDDADAFTPTRRKGQVCCSDRYFAEKYHRQEQDQNLSRHGCTCDHRDHHDGSRSNDWWHTPYNADRPKWLFAHHVELERPLWENTLWVVDILRMFRRNSVMPSTLLEKNNPSRCLSLGVIVRRSQTI